MSETGKLLVELEQQVKNLMNLLQVLVSRYPDSETVITPKEMEERSDVGVVVAQPQVDGGYLMKVRQR